MNRTSEQRNSTNKGKHRQKEKEHKAQEDNVEMEESERERERERTTNRRDDEGGRLSAHRDHTRAQKSR